MGVLRSEPYKYYVWPLSLLYLCIAFGTILYIHNSLPAFYKGMYASYTVPFTILTIITSIQLGVALTLIIAKIRELRAKSAGLGIVGIAIGSLAAGCPGCFFGLFPLFLSAFGISATLAILPFNGLELQTASAIILGLSIYTLGKETDLSCEIRKREKR
jgi:hypothetical protein